MTKTDVISRTKSVGMVTVTAAALLLAKQATLVGAQVPTGGISEGAGEAQGDSQVGSSLFDEGGVFRTVTNILLFLVGAISVIMLIIGGIRYVVSGGDQQAVTNAKNTILYAIVGIVVAFLSWAAVDFVSTNLEA